MTSIRGTVHDTNDSMMCSRVWSEKRRPANVERGQQMPTNKLTALNIHQRIAAWEKKWARLPAMNKHLTVRMRTESHGPYLPWILHTVVVDLRATVRSLLEQKQPGRPTTSVRHRKNTVQKQNQYITWKQEFNFEDLKDMHICSCRKARREGISTYSM